MTTPLQGILAVAPAGAATASLLIARGSAATLTIAPVVRAYVTAKDAIPANPPQVIASPLAPVVITTPETVLIPPQAPVLP